MLSKNAEANIFDFYIFSIAHSLRYMNDQKLLEYDITNRQARLLGIIYRCIESKEEINNKKLQDMMDLKGPSITSLLNNLEKKEFVVRIPNSKDRRVIEYKVTKKSRDLIEDMEKIFGNTEQCLLKGMIKEERDAFLRLLKIAHKNISSDC